MPEAQAAPRRGRPGYDQETVLRRAIDLFNRQGYDATSMGDLAGELGLTKSAIYHHVPSKGALLEQALTEALDRLGRILDEAESCPGSAEDKLRQVVRGSVLVLVEHQPAVTLLLRVRGNSQVEQRALQRRRRIDERLAKLVREAIAEGSLRDDVRPELVSRLLFGMVNSLVEWFRPRAGVGREQEVALVAEGIVAMAFDGLVRDRRCG